MLQTLRKAQGMLRQLSQEKADLEAKTAALEEQVKALEPLRARIKQLEPLENEVKQHKASIESMQAGNAALQERLSGDSERLRAAAENQKKTLGALESYRRDNTLLVNAVLERTHWIEECSGKNQALLRANREWIDRQGKKSLWDDIEAAEPLTGIGAVAEENAAEEFRYKLGDLEVTPWREPGAASPVADAGAQPEDSEQNGNDGGNPAPNANRTQ